ncbi:hypothetical protein GCM10022243_10080 [Saccharothrix violaceirubra]|uniref:Transcriptional regulator with XRE-family HTH domain n=1 Tax=Saccharothrix violaceirubra TaxID=413306 RepID=A0A7W7WX17_9PSEU|nr:helix-turn-helix transcriptional regulator [Saccharothrix violaceirubra]MBB4966153.1 transcriptional regulator with XRE-family HTH domain [Saccharothrix violaceirubra]
MSVTVGGSDWTSDGRTCAECGTPLEAGNSAQMCNRCHRASQDQLRTPPILKDQFFDTAEFRAASDSQHIGRIIKVYRHHPRHLKLYGRALSQELVGRWLGLTQAQISKVENAPRAEQNLEVLRRYAKTLHLPQSLLWFSLPPQGRYTERGVSTTGIDAAKLRQDLSEVLASTLISERGASDWDEAVFRLGRDTRWRPHATLASEILANLSELRVFYVRATSGHVLQRMARNTAQLSGLMSQTLLKVGDISGSADWSRTARQFASESNDLNLRAWVHAQEAYLHFYAGNMHTAIDAARYAQDIAGKSGGVGSALAAALEARAYANQGLRADALRAIGIAESLTAGLDGAATIASAFGYSEAQLRFHESNVLTKLGEFQRALVAQDHALRLTPHDDFMDRALVYFDRADSLIAQGDIVNGLAIAASTLGELETGKAAGLIVDRARLTLRMLPVSESGRVEALALHEIIAASNEFEG